MNESQKYCRSLHAPISLGTTSDDRFMPKGFLKAFAEMQAGHILTEKLDGENNAFTKYGLFARSHTSPTVSPWTKPLRERWDLIKNDLGDLELFGEGMFGVHSIGYKNLESYYYLFGVREKGRWLSWEEVKFYAALFDFPTVPEVPIKIALKDFYRDGVDEDKQLQEWFKANLGMLWTESINTPGMLGGYDLETGKPASEGFVFRNADSFETNDGVIPVEDNEFNNLFKVVRPGHVKTDEHWTKNWTEAHLMDYHKYNWSSYEYISIKKEREAKLKHEQHLKDTIPGYEYIGKIIRYKGEYGVMVLSSTLWPLQEGEEDCVVMRWDERRELGVIFSGGNWFPEFVDEPHEFKHINMDGTLKTKI